MIRTQIVPCKLNKDICDNLNLASGSIYSGIVSRHWRILRKKNLWLKEKSLTRLSDMRASVQVVPMHAHSIDAAQQALKKACVTTRALRKAGFPEANFPWRSKKFRTTIWKATAIKFKAGKLELSTGSGNPKIVIALPDSLWSALKFLEVRLVFDKKFRRYTWHIVLENGIVAKTATGRNTVSVDMGEIHRLRSAVTVGRPPRLWRSNISSPKAGAVPTGLLTCAWLVSRVIAVRSSGTFNVGKIQGIGWKYCKTLHRSDGYSYSSSALAMG